MALEAGEVELCCSDDHGSFLLQRLNQLRHEGLLCDFSLQIGKRTFMVHRAVMASCSDYFHALSSHDMIDSKNTCHRLHGLSVSGVTAIIDYAYTGTIPLTLSTVASVLDVAVFLQVIPAIKLCTQFLERNMTFSNAVKIADLGSRYGIRSLTDHHHQMVLSNFIRFTHTDEFLRLDGKTLAEYLEDDALQAPDELSLLQAVMTWLEYAEEERSKDIHVVLDKIRYTNDGWPTIELAMNSDLFQRHAKCRDIVTRCQQYMQKPLRKHLSQSYRTRVRYHRQTLVQMGGIAGVVGYDIEREQDPVCCNHYYHRDLDHWVSLGVVGLSDVRSHCPLVEVNDFGVMVGGYLYMTDVGHEEVFQHCTNEVKLLTPSGFALWDLPYMSEPRAHHVAVHVQGFLYAIGGKNELGILRSVEQFDLDKETWTFVQPMENALFDHAGTAFKDQVYVSGGVVCDAVISTTWCYTPATDTWTRQASMLTARTGHSMAAVESLVFVCGGKSHQEVSRCLSSVESYDPRVDQWSFVTPMRYDCCYMATVVLDNKLLVVGGEDSIGDLSNEIQQYDPSTSRWQHFSQLPMPLKNFGCCALTIKLNQHPTDEDDGAFKGVDYTFGLPHRSENCHR